MQKTLVAVGVMVLLVSSLAAGDTPTYASARVGPLFFLGDLDDLDTGVNFNAALGVKPADFLAFEIESGYFWGEETGDVDAELWGVPLLVNAKLTIPIAFLEAYAGAGVGGFYLDAEVESRDDDDWVFGGDVFGGLGISVGPLSLGAEAKYYLSQDADLFGDDVRFEGVAAMVTARIDF